MRLPFLQQILATVLGTVIMVLWAELASRCCPGHGVERLFCLWAGHWPEFCWHQALAAVFVASVLFILFSFSRFVAG